MRGLLRPLFLLMLAGVGCSPAAEDPELPAAPEDSLLHILTRPAPGGEVHLVRMVAQGARYAFEPAEVHVQPGDLVRFVMTGRQTESIAFDTLQAPSGGAEFLRRAGLVRGVLLTGPGQVYEASFREAPPGRYGFYSVPHAWSGMRGLVVVEPAD